MDSSRPLIENEDRYLTTSKFESCEALVKSAREYYYTKGYGVSIRNSKKDKFVTLQCDRGGSYRDIRGIQDKRQKKATTRLISCPFRIIGSKGVDGTWVYKPKHLKHNHEPSSDMSGHPSFRKLPPDTVQTVEEMTKSGTPPRQILSSLRQQNPDLPANSRTIYNVKRKIKRDNLGNQSVIGALFEEFEKDGFLYDVLHDSERHITSLFIVHPLSIKLAKLFSYAFVMDCTYKTNRFNMPLLDIVGISCFNTSFYSGFAFLESEDEESYTWALKAFKNMLGQGSQLSVIISHRELALMNAIKNVFRTVTNLLCVWHIEKNVLAKCKKHFQHNEEFDIFMASWNNVVYSVREAMFVTNWVEFELFYNDKREALEYIKSTWLPWKEKFVNAWTEKYLHFGNRCSSRAEGAHAKVKKYLEVSTGGFKEVKDKICLAVEHEFNEIKIRVASEKIQIPHNCDMPIFRDLLLSVSHFALQEIYKQYEKISNGTMTPCTGHFTATMSLPCAHKIKGHREKSLSLELVHPQWRINSLSLNTKDALVYDGYSTFHKLLDELDSKYLVWPLNKKEFATSMIFNLINQSEILFEPMVQRPKGRPPKSKKRKGKTFTTQDPSRFELVESSRTQNPSSSACSFQICNDLVNEVSYGHNDNISYDFSIYRDVSSDIGQ
uniref:protein FAR1-RELATED SEQUENCE 5-like n=1 Tax=Erigeron canadensis TaxID=72917 RepID=UPI001CB89F7E|nr:protein FAR1-RELATED SEQUENCE 5-like [Erigeron canadensis]